MKRDIYGNLSKNHQCTQKGYLSLGQFAKSLDKTHKEILKLLSIKGVDMIDYSFEDNIKFIANLLKK